MYSSEDTKLLIVNPNSSVSITESFRPLLSKLTLSDIEISYWTCPTGPSILKSQADLVESAFHCLKPLLAIESEYDGFLIACYADHPLTALLQKYVSHKPVVGIFEASVTTALHLVNPGTKFGIITTGHAYEAMLTEGVRRVLGIGKGGRNSSFFGSVVATGISPDVLENESTVVIRSRVLDAVRAMVGAGDVGVICMGGVILAGLEGWVREACVEVLGPDIGEDVKVVDQMLAGVTTLHSLIKLDA